MSKPGDITTVVKITSREDAAARRYFHRVGESIDMEIDGVRVGEGIGVGITSDADGTFVTINGQRPIYRTQVYFNDVLFAEDQGLIAEKSIEVIPLDRPQAGVCLRHKEYGRVDDPNDMISLTCDLPRGHGGNTHFDVTRKVEWTG